MLNEKVIFTLDLISTEYYKNNLVEYESLFDKKIKIEYTDHIPLNQISLLTQSRKFINYFNNFDFESCFINVIKILNIFMFADKIGFADLEISYSLSKQKNSNFFFTTTSSTKTQMKNLQSTIEEQNKLQINSISKKNSSENKESNEEIIKKAFVFLRGGAVAILTILNNKYLILAKQFRVPLGKFKTGIPAGMLDESGDFCGVAAKELEEETGVKINFKDLVYLCSFYTTSEYCDEEMNIFAAHVNLSQEEVDFLLSKEYGDGNHEIITLGVVPFCKEEILRLNNMTIFSAAFAYEKRIGISIPEKFDLN